jgi:hypothetical protein
MGEMISVVNEVGDHPCVSDDNRDEKDITLRGFRAENDDDDEGDVIFRRSVPGILTP